MAPDDRPPRRAAGADDDRVAESEPLLSNDADASYGANDTTDTHGESRRPSQAESSSKSGASKRRRFRWPSLIAIFVLAGVVISVMVLGFLVPPAVQTYVENAVVVEPTGLSLESINKDGVRARVQASFRLDGSRVSDVNARRLGRFALGVMRKIGAEETEVKIYVPQYGNSMVGSAIVPPITLDLIDGRNTVIDVVTDLKPGDGEGVRAIVNDWLTGKLTALELKGTAALQLKSGFVPLGTHDVVESMVLEATGDNVPTIPDYKIQSLSFQEVPLEKHGKTGIGANVSLSVQNDYPIALTVPRIGFEILVPACDPSEPKIVVASASSNPIEVKAKAEVVAEAQGLMRDLPKRLTKSCPMSELSPLDEFLRHYLGGDEARVFVRGKRGKDSDLPEWISSLLENTTVPVAFPGRSFDNLLRNFSMNDVEFKLPNPFAGPRDPDSKPRVSGNIVVLAALPEGINIDLRVESLRALGNLTFQDENFGELNLREWQSSNTTRINTPEGEENLLRITSKIVDAPIDITDSNVFSALMQEYMFGDDDIILDVYAAVDVKVATVLGNLVLKQVPATGKVPVNGMPGDINKSIEPHVGGVWILNTTDKSLNIEASVNFTNPTPYSASIPSFSIHVLAGDCLVGSAAVQDLYLTRGNMTNVSVAAIWDPVEFGGAHCHATGQKLLSDYISGKNTTISLRAHRESIPGMPIVGEALSKINMTFSTPRVELPGDDDGDGEASRSFINEAVFHILSSTASFQLASPLRHNTVHIEHINATAFYNHTEPVGHILYDEEFDAPPGLSQSPKIPVEWNADTIGYDKLRSALGGSLYLDAIADVTVRLGNWIEVIHYEGHGIGAKVRL